MALGPDTLAQFGSRFTTPTEAAYDPLGWGPQTTGVPQVSPSLPPFLGGSAAGSTGLGGEGVGGYGTAGNNALVASLANQNPHNLKVSPVWWAVIFLLFGLFLLKGIHWRETTLEGFEARGRVGEAEAEASEEA